MPLAFYFICLFYRFLYAWGVSAVYIILCFATLLLPPCPPSKVTVWLLVWVLFSIGNIVIIDYTKIVKGIVLIGGVMLCAPNYGAAHNLRLLRDNGEVGPRVCDNYDCQNIFPSMRGILNVYNARAKIDLDRRDDFPSIRGILNANDAPCGDRF